MLLLLLSGPPAHAGATLIECPVTVESQGQSWVVAGWGMTRDQAAHAAWDDARILAQIVHGERFWSSALMGLPQAVRPLEVALQATQEGQPVPDVTLTPGVCTELDIAAKGRWTVAWGEGPQVERGDPASALSAARQVACLASARAPLQDGLRAVAVAAEVDKGRFLELALADALDPVAACWSAATPMPVARGDAAQEQGWYRCSAVDWERGRAEVAAVGWGATLDAAAADAQQARVLGGLLASEGLASQTLARASAETRLSLGAAAFVEWSVAFGSGQDAVRQAGLVCERAALPKQGQVAWLPDAPDEARDCGADGLPATATWSGDPVALADTVRTRCDRHRDAGHQMMSQAADHASGEVKPMLIHAGWSVVTTCEAACLAHHRVPDVAWTPAPLPGQPDRSSADAASAALADALAAQDLDALYLAAPWLDRLVYERRMEPQTLFYGLAQQPLDVVPFRGHWLLSPTDGRG